MKVDIFFAGHHHIVEHSKYQAGSKSLNQVTVGNFARQGGCHPHNIVKSVGGDDSTETLEDYFVHQNGNSIVKVKVSSSVDVSTVDVINSVSGADYGKKLFTIDIGKKGDMDSIGPEDSRNSLSEGFNYGFVFAICILFAISN